jgi:hypothetical protein
MMLVDKEKPLSSVAPTVARVALNCSDRQTCEKHMAKRVRAAAALEWQGHPNEFNGFTFLAWSCQG